MNQVNNDIQNQQEIIKKSKSIFERNQVFSDIKQYFKDVKQLTDLTYLQNEDYQLIFETIETTRKFLGTVLNNENQQRRYQVKGEDKPDIAFFINTKLNHYFYMKVHDNRIERNSWLSSEKNRITDYLETDKLEKLLASGWPSKEEIKNKYFKRAGYVMSLIQNKLKNNQLKQNEIKELSTKLDVLKDYFNQETKKLQDKENKDEYKKYAILTRTAYQTFYALESKKEKETILKNQPIEKERE